MSERARVLKVGGTLLALVAAGLVIGFFTLRGDDASPPAASSQIGSPTPTVTDPRVQVEQAYLHAWDVWAEALMTLDPSRLPEVLTGDALELVRGQVEAQRETNQPVRVRVEHDYRIVLIDAVTASVDDRYINHNVRLDAGTLEPIEEDPNEQVRRSFTLRAVDGTWKIAEIIGYEP